MYETMEKHVHSLKQELHDTTCELHELRELQQEQIHEYEKINEQKENIENEHRTLKDQLEISILRQRDVTSQLHDVNTRYVLLLSDMAHVQEQMATLQNDVKTRDATIKSKDMELSDKNRLLIEREMKLQQTTHALEKIKQEKTKLMEDKRKLELELITIEELKADIVAKQQIIDTQIQQYKQKTADFNALQAQYQDMSAQHAILHKQHHDVQTTLARYKNDQLFFTKEIDRYQADKTSLGEQLALVKRQLQDKTSEFHHLQSEYAMLQDKHMRELEIARVTPKKHMDQQKGVVGVSDTQHTTTTTTTTASKKESKVAPPKPAPLVEKPKVLVFSGFKDGSSHSKQQESHLISIVHRLGGSVDDGHDIRQHVTHCVRPDESHTQKSLACGLMGKWLMRPQWLEECDRQNRWISEDEYGQRYTSNPLLGKRIALDESFKAQCNQKPSEKPRLNLLKSLMNAGGATEIYNWINEPSGTSDIVIVSDPAARALKGRNGPETLLVWDEFLKMIPGYAKRSSSKRTSTSEETESAGRNTPTKRRRTDEESPLAITTPPRSSSISPASTSSTASISPHIPKVKQSLSHAFDNEEDMSEKENKPVQQQQRVSVRRSARK